MVKNVIDQSARIPTTFRLQLYNTNHHVAQLAHILKPFTNDNIITLEMDVRGICKQKTSR